MINTEKLDWQLQEITYAATALMLAVAKSDFEEDPQEEAVIVSTVKSIFGINDDTMAELLKYAHSTTDNSNLSEFTDLVNLHYDDNDKITLTDCLWRVAIADGRIDHFEEQFIASVAKLIGVSEAQVQASKQRVSSSDP
jgi:uncharacterized tellurite resistance protein B-like protein